MDISTALIDYLLNMADAFGYAISVIGGLFLVIGVGWLTLSWIASRSQGRQP